MLRRNRQLVNAVQKTDFILGRDSFADLTVVPHMTKGLYGFRHSKREQMVRYFVLAESKELVHVCEVKLIKDKGKFTPRLHFSIRYREDTTKFARVTIKRTEDTFAVRASVSLSGCHENYWELISYLKSLRELDTPDKHFSLIPYGAEQIAAALTKHAPETVTAVLRLLSAHEGLRFSEVDADEVLRRRARLEEFRRGLDAKWDEASWKEFFDHNKWIFGYGLDYRILRIEHSQANVGGAGLSGTGGRIPDYAVSTTGDARFMVFVEIKTAETLLLAGSKPQRNGAWMLSRDLVDGLTQVQACIQEWNSHGSKQDDNMEEMQRKNIRSIQPKAILVIGCLAEIKETLTKLTTFELFRQSLHGVEIITFDELYGRAKFIVEHTSESGSAGQVASL
jgi:Domain of unknown function (DUF4263)